MTDEQPRALQRLAELAAREQAWEGSFLGGLPAHAQDELAETALPMKVPTGHVIYRRDDHPRLVLIVSGLVRVVTTSAEGRRATIRYARSADCIGALSVVTSSQRVMVEAVTEAEVLFINVDRLRRLARSEAEIGWQLATFVGAVTTDVIDMMSATVFGTVRERVARHLLDLAVRRDGELIVMHEQQEIADSIGSVREVVARTLRDFRERGLLSRDHGALVLTDAAALHRIAVADPD
ncbi:Crp/Fnr family transcriptional regulator [Gordonia shandongensis]|uniref:Crp/Fnr family transcriptional regulator n=1 Tax=Gordonia shandongensis TaxID=376351 RepID=UPI0004139951|nr:Crp/Fnr family transcriptional regulator [Gordonia shandongensis]